jgi:hypothetical protein
VGGELAEGSAGPIMRFWVWKKSWTRGWCLVVGSMQEDAEKKTKDLNYDNYCILAVMVLLCEQMKWSLRLPNIYPSD